MQYVVYMIPPNTAWSRKIVEISFKRTIVEFYHRNLSQKSTIEGIRRIYVPCTYTQGSN